ncbi:hypothetical protein ACVWYN_002488 [Pedobacter sp. UYP24]
MEKVLPGYLSRKNVSTNNQLYANLMIKSQTAILVAIVAFTLSFQKTDAQSIDSVKAKAEYGFKNEEVKILAELDRIDYYKVSFQKKQLKGNPYLLFTTKEYLKGKIVKSEELIPAEVAKQYYKFKNIDSSTTISLTTKPKGDSVTFLYGILNQRIPRTYKRLADDRYSLRDGLVTNEAFKSIPVNTTLPIFAYSLPYEDPKQPGYLFYCAITANGVPPEKWWDTYKIPHYIIVEIKIVTE